MAIDIGVDTKRPFSRSGGTQELPEAPAAQPAPLLSAQAQALGFSTLDALKREVLRQRATWWQGERFHCPLCDEDYADAAPAADHVVRLQHPVLRVDGVRPRTAAPCWADAELDYVRALRGPNLHARTPVLKVTLMERKADGVAARPVTSRFTTRLATALPGLAGDHGIRSLQRRLGSRSGGAPIALAARLAAQELLRLAGHEPEIAKMLPDPDPQTCGFLLGYTDEALGRLAVEAAAQLTLAAWRGTAYDIAGDLDRLRALSTAPSPNVRRMAVAAPGRPGRTAAVAAPGRGRAGARPGAVLAQIPVIAVTGTNGKTTTTRLIAHMYETADHVVGLTSTEGTYIDGERVMKGDCSGPKSARTILSDERVEAAVLETARGGILREGLAFESCTVGVVTNVTADHLGIGGVHTLADLARVKQVVVQAVRPDGAAVLNADDPLVAGMVAATEARTVFFSTSARNAVVTEHLSRGGAAVLAQDGEILLAAGNLRTRVARLEAVPFTAGGRILFQVKNALAATAAAWAAGLGLRAIARALATFQTDAATVPGRFNVGEYAGVEVVLDYAHNPGALEALGAAVQALAPRRTILAIGLPGDRRDDDLHASMAATLGWVDEYVLCDHGDRRGRTEGEVPRLLQRVVPSSTPSVCATSQADGISLAWERARPGDRIVVIVYDAETALAQVQALAHAAPFGGPQHENTSGNGSPRSA